MSEEKEPVKENRVRLRLSIRPELAEVLGQLADAMKVDDNTAALMALSIGARQLSLLAQPPYKEMAPVMEDRAALEASKVALDLGLPSRQR